ncbi:hypothetical protein KY284_000763 [Solanum tuberosum]|nr:hypothetical protein KY284_000763 [Solanum tuberosum]
MEMKKAVVEDYGNKAVVVEIRNDMLEEEKGLVVMVDDGNNLAGEVEKAVVEICNNVEEVVMVMVVEVIYNSDGVAEAVVEVIYNSDDVAEVVVEVIYNSDDVVEEVVEAIYNSDDVVEEAAEAI